MKEKISKEKYLCPNCYNKGTVKIINKNYDIEVKDILIEFSGFEALCSKCGQIVPVKRIEEHREKTLALAYCRKLNLITVDEIEKILDIYGADKRQLPFLINIGEHTIERYLKGQIPNKRISEMLKSFLFDYNNFKKMYLENKDDSRVTDNTRKKVSAALDRLETINSSNTKIEAVALYIINSGYEITNLALQKLLYYADAVNMLKTDRVLFENDCEAWVHGPVYPIIYNKYREFGRTQIYDCDLDKSYLQKISNEEKEVLDYVLKNFAIYNGKVLEHSTHRESPWLEAREGYFETEASDEIIRKDSIKEYFENIKEEFDILKPDCVVRYIQMVV